MALRSTVAVAVKCIGGPAGTMTGGPPVCPTMTPSGVSRPPCSVYYASGPECVCVLEVMPGVKIASM
jgi:hypothetical protein